MYIMTHAHTYTHGVSLFRGARLKGTDSYVITIDRDGMLSYNFQLPLMKINLIASKPGRFHRFVRFVKKRIAKNLVAAFTYRIASITTPIAIYCYTYICMYIKRAKHIRVSPRTVVRA